MTKKKKRHIILLIVLIVAVILLAAVGIVYAKLNMMQTFPEEGYMTESQVFAEEYTENAPEDTIADSEIDWAEIESEEVEGITNILLIGQDRREGETGNTRSDSMIVCSVDGNSGRIVLTSLMRDMYLPIPGYQDNRLNASYALGGVELLDQTIENDLGIHIDGNASVDLAGFVEAMASVGDITVDLTAEEADYMTKNISFGSASDSASDFGTLHEGTNQLNASQALSYARIRKVGNSDYERTERQRKVLMAALNNLKSVGFNNALATADQILPNITTDIPKSKILRIIYDVLKNGGTVAGSYRLPEDGLFTPEVIRGMQVLVPDLQANAEAFKTNIEEAFS